MWRKALTNFISIIELVFNGHGCDDINVDVVHVRTDSFVNT